jgi:hypothetical protein
MKPRKLVCSLFIAPFTGLLIATKLSVWLSGKELLVDNDAVGHFLWISIVAGVVVIIAVRNTIGFSLINCLVAGVMVFGLIDLVNMTGFIRVYKENIAAAGFDPSVGVAKVAGGAVYGLWFWFLNPFNTYTPRATFGRTLSTRWWLDQ